MGRPRKQPRRIMTFNLNVPLAEAIDGLPVKNRSEWANKVLKEVLDQRIETRRDNINQRIEAAKEEGADEFQQRLRTDPFALPQALRIAINALENAGMGEFKPVGRYTTLDILKRTYLETIRAEHGSIGSE